jgi:hypothetical protein
MPRPTIAIVQTAPIQGIAVFFDFLGGMITRTLSRFFGDPLASRDFGAARAVMTLFAVS